MVSGTLTKCIDFGIALIIKAVNQPDNAWKRLLLHLTDANSGLWRDLAVSTANLSNFKQRIIKIWEAAEENIEA